MVNGEPAEAYFRVVNGEVVNVELWTASNAANYPELFRCEDHPELSYNPVPPGPALQPGEMEVTRWTIPADGQTYAVARYGTDEPVYYLVNGAEELAVPTDGVAELGICATGTGGIVIHCREHVCTIVAEAVGA